MVMPAAAAAGGHTTAHAVSSEYIGGSVPTQIVLLMSGAAVVIFVQNAKNGKAQDGNQYIAIGVVGFILLFLSEFFPSIGFAFAVLFFVAVMLNSPNGIPVIDSKSKTSTTTTQGN
jgi:hypothetical protein